MIDFKSIDKGILIRNCFENNCFFIMCPFQRCTASISNLVYLSRFLTPSFSVYTKLLLEWKYPGFNELGDMDAAQCWIWGESVAFYEKKIT